MPIPQPSIVGRDAELAQLDLAVKATRAGAGHTYFLVGEAGIGKSRLVDEIAARCADTQIPVLRGRADASTSHVMPFRPLVEALSSHLRTGTPPDNPSLLPCRPALGRLIPEWRTAASGEHPHTLTETAEALLRLLIVLGLGTGCLLVLEDLHDADPETVAVVEYLADNIAHTPILLVVTMRPEPGRMLDTANAAHRRRIAVLTELRPLQVAHVRDLVAQRLATSPESVPDSVVGRLHGDAGGVPYLVEELLAAMLGKGALRRDELTGDWCLGDLGSFVPDTIVHDHAERLDRLGPAARETLVRAAVLGTRFTVSALAAVTGRPEPELLAHLRTATQARLLVAGVDDAQRYAFRHDLTTQAILSTLLPAELAATARDAATALRQAYPELPAGLCELVAELLLRAGDRAQAAAYYADAGRRALDDGSTGSAIALFERAAEHCADGERSTVAEALIRALAEDGQVDRALAQFAELTASVTVMLGTHRRIELHTRLAGLAMSAHRLDEARAQIAAARALLGESPADELAAPLTIIEANLSYWDSQAAATGQRADEHRARARQLARSCVDIAERAPLPVVACQAWLLLAMIGREQSFEEAEACLRRVLAISDECRLPAIRADALLRLGINESLRTGEVIRLEQALASARTLGSLALENTTECVLALTTVLRGQYARTAELLKVATPLAWRLGDAGNGTYALLTSAVLAAHQGRRTEMERELATFRRQGGEETPLQPLAWGLAYAFCALLEEDRGGARDALAMVLAGTPATPGAYHLTGRYGLHPLLDALAGGYGWPEFSQLLATPSAGLAWNRQFVELTRAVLLGRDGRADEAALAVDAAQAAGAPFPLTVHLGLRLVAEAALAGGWGEPVAWLRAAEEYFHTAGVPAVVVACRALLRGAGASLAQRRQGSDQIPAALRRQGVTAREHEVLLLVAEGAGNQEIARKLCIAPRTVEKHIANLLSKTGSRDRTALAALIGDPAAS